MLMLIPCLMTYHTKLFFMIYVSFETPRGGIVNFKLIAIKAELFEYLSYFLFCWYQHILLINFEFFS